MHIRGTNMISSNGVWDLIAQRAAATPDAIFMVDDSGAQMTFGEFAERAEQVAAGLYDLSVREGSVVSWQLPTWIEAAVLVGALSRLGATQNPLVPIYREKEVGFIVQQAGPRLMVMPGTWRGYDYSEMAERVAAQANDAGGDVTVISPGRELPIGDPAVLPAPPAVADDPDAAPVRWIFYSSGTTADPKGAQHTDPSVIAGAMVNVTAVGWTPDDVILLVFPFTHIGGIGLMLGAIAVGCRLALVEAFTPEGTAKVCFDQKVTVAGGATPIHQALLAVHRAQPEAGLLKTVRVYPGGGASKPPALHYEMKEELDSVGIVSGYGLTECPILAMNKITDSDEHLANTEGAPAPGVTVKIVTLDGTVAGVGEVGEIRVKAPQLMRGYLDPELNDHAFDDEGFFRTGDLGKQDDEGFITITGRLKDVIIRKGENISAVEVENLLYTHPKIADVAVIGVPDEALGERCCAVVVLAPDVDELTVSEVFDFCKEGGLMTQKIPEQIEVIDALPRNPTGKILKGDLRKTYANG
ncbi:MAG: AMP-binding protein [Acidimicrobiia bacterium]|nr:AMP-binding protein [Acidimicrobiia bacterium]